jgi:hypothetical protein
MTNDAGKRYVGCPPWRSEGIVKDIIFEILVSCNAALSVESEYEDQIFLNGQIDILQVHFLLDDSRLPLR